MLDWNNTDICHFEYFNVTLMILYILYRFLLVVLNVYLYYSISCFWISNSKTKCVPTLTHVVQVWECPMCQAWCGFLGKQQGAGPAQPALRELSLGPADNSACGVNWEACYSEPARGMLHLCLNSPVVFLNGPMTKRQWMFFGPREWSHWHCIFLMIGVGIWQKQRSQYLKCEVCMPHVYFILAFSFLFLFKLEFIEMTLVNKTLQVSSAQSSGTRHLHTGPCAHHPQSGLLLPQFTLLCPPLPPCPPLPLVITLLCLCLFVYLFVFA